MVDYVFKSYNVAYPALFENEKKRLERFLTGHFKIDHFGSTAVPGLGGKGIIDMYLIVSKDHTSTILKQIGNAGYSPRPNSGTKERFIYVREYLEEKGQKVRYHLHITHPASEDYKNCIVFRDYLRTHPEDAQIYALVKKQASQQPEISKEKYMSFKEPIILSILEKALQVGL